MTENRLSLYQISGFNKTLSHYTQAGTKSALLSRAGIFVVLWMVCFRFKLFSAPVKLYIAP
jgi:hypothetical protein